MKPISRFLSICVIATTTLGEFIAYGATMPKLPQTQVDVSMPAVTGNTYSVTSCANLQSTINTAAAADATKTHAINVAVSLICTGPYTLPAHAGGAGWILIRSANYTSLPAPGTRVSPTDAANMPTIKYGQGNENAAIYAETNAQRYRLIGLNIVSNSSYNPNWMLVGTGYGGAQSTNTGYIILDRVLLRITDSTIKTGRAVYGDADLGHTALIDSYCSGIYGTTSVIGDSQCWLSITNAGPILLRNNYLQAAGENIMFCGGEPRNINFNQQYMPKDITIQRNLVEKNVAAWNTDAGYNVKTLFELKCGLRVLVEGNTFQNQTGYQGDVAFRLTPRNEYINPSYIEVSDLTVRHNLLRNITNWINAIASDDGNVYPGTFPGSGSYSNHAKRWSFNNNLVYGLGTNCYPGSTCGSIMSIAYGGSGNKCYDYVITCKLEDLTFIHNTIDPISLHRWLCIMSPGEVVLDYRDNLIDAANGYGIYNCDSGADGIGTAALTKWYGANWSMTYNTVAGVANAGSYPAGTNSYPSNYTSIQWKSPCVTAPCTGTYDYTLLAGSPAKNSASDGTDRGVDFIAFTAAQSGAGSSSGGADTIAPNPPNNLIVTTP